jgi:hypothetical protein
VHDRQPHLFDFLGVVEILHAQPVVVVQIELCDFGLQTQNGAQA